MSSSTQLSLLSGKQSLIRLQVTSSVYELRQLVQRELNKGIWKLVAASGPETRDVKCIRSSDNGFAAVTADGSVVSWGMGGNRIIGQF